MLLRWFEHHQVFAPSNVLAATGQKLGRPWEDVWFTADDGVRLNGWFFPANDGAARARLVLLVFHGNLGNLGDRLHYFDAWLSTGVNVFAIDYRGYGRSEGKPGEAGTYLDARAAREWLVQRGFAPEHIIAFGKSLGGGVASELAIRETIGGLILQNTYTSIPDVGSEIFPWLPVRRIARIRYDTHSKLPRVQVPVLVMHSRADDLIGFHHGERNFAAANEPKMFWEITGAHNGVLTAGCDQYLEGLEKFLKRFFD